MKVIIILVFLGTASSVYSQGIDSVILAIDNYLETTGMKYREECIIESGMDRAALESFEKQGILPRDDNFKCYARCQGLRAEVIDEKGVINVATLKSVLKATNQQFIDMVEANCKFPSEGHVCEAAFATCTCIYYILHDHHHIH